MSEKNSLDALYENALKATQPSDPPKVSVVQHTKPKTPGRYTLTKDQREYLTSGVLACVNDAYTGWTRGRGREPAVTLGYLFDWFDTNAGWGPITDPRELVSVRPGKYESERLRAFHKQTLRFLVRSVAEKLRRTGKLASSTGLSDSGREARCYEPSAR
jgi:hypothetical protein